MNTPPTSLLLSLLALSCGPSTVLAGSPVISPMAADTTFTPNFVLDLSAQYEFADESPAGPSGDVIRGRVGIPLFIPLSREWRIIGVLRGGYSDYETAPFDNDGLQTWNVGALLTLDGQLNDTWSITFGALGGASWEDGASFSDSLIAGGLIMAGYRVSPTLKFGLGGLYLTRINEDPLAVPALGLDWQVTDNFEITLYGLDLRAEYDVSDVWSLYLRGEYDPNGALLKERQGSDVDSFDDQGTRVAGGVKWSPSSSFSLSLEGGVAFHEYTLRNDREEILAKDRLDPAPFVGVSARLSF